MKAYSYRLPLKRPLPLPGGNVLKFREGILVHSPQTGGWGDAAPLPGFSRETVDEVRMAIQQDEWDAPLPSLQFAVCCAQQEWKPPIRPVSCNALWVMAAETEEEVAHRLVEWENPVVKIKPGADPDLQGVKSLISRRPDLRVRIDGNRQWTIEQTLRFMEKLPVEAVDYVEEPLANPEEYVELWKRVPVPVGLDETLLDPLGKELASEESVVAYVLKPTLLGGGEALGFWRTLAETKQKRVVWSSCFESGVGCWQIAVMAQGGEPAGLDTSSWLHEDVMRLSCLPERGVLLPPSSLSFRSDALRPL